MTERPTTAAGRRLLAQMHPNGRAEPDGSKVMALIGLAYDAHLETVLAIEVEARQQDASALVRLMENEGVVEWGDDRHRERFLAALPPSMEPVA